VVLWMAAAGTAEVWQRREGMQQGVPTEGLQQPVTGDVCQTFSMRVLSLL
jgi:hypothetical protein